MLQRCYQCGYRKSSISYGSEPESDEDDDNFKTEGYYCECEDTADESMTTGAQKQNNNLAKMQLGRVNAFKAQDAGKGNFDVTFDLDGKLLHAHKIMITTVSTTLEAWISERWSTKDTAIKIETYTFEEFFQFLTFLYSGTCDITQDNIFRLVDMAEFFIITIMKEHCDKCLSKIIQNIGVESVGEVLEMAEKYILSKSIEAIYKFIRQNREKIIKSDEFVKFKRPFIDVLFSVPKNTYHEQHLYLSVYKWAEHQVSMKEPTPEGTDFLNAVKVELNEIKMKFNFSVMTFAFFMRWIATKNFLYSTSDFLKILEKCLLLPRDKEIYCKLAVLFAEREAYEEENASTDENFNLENVIKGKLSRILPRVNFKHMKFDFFKEFIVERAFLFPPKKLYKIVADCERTDEEEIDLFAVLSQLAKNNVEKGKLPGEVYDIPKAIKAELSECLPKIKFQKMGTEFLVDFAAKTGFMSNQEAIHCSYINVQIKSGGKILNGEFEDISKIYNCANGGVRRYKNGWTFDFKPNSKKKHRFAGLKFKVPSSPSPIHYMGGVEWYLLLGMAGTLAVKHQSMITREDYLIAELRGSENFGFDGQGSRIAVSHNKIFK